VDNTKRVYVCVIETYSFLVCYLLWFRARMVWY